jgi:hypothetical protein
VIVARCLWLTLGHEDDFMLSFVTVLIGWPSGCGRYGILVTTTSDGTSQEQATTANWLEQPISEMCIDPDGIKTMK